MKKHIMLFILLLFININLVYAKETVKYTGCVDGDTFKVIIKDKKVTVRLLAVDTPEVAKEDKPGEYYGKEASDYTCKRIKNAKKIELEYDANSDKYDKYDRLLAWVFLDGKLLQTDLVRLGYAKVAYLYDDYKYTDILKSRQELASAKGIGIWNVDDKNNDESSSNSIEEDIENKEIIVLAVIFLLITLLGDLIIRSRKKIK